MKKNKLACIALAALLTVSVLAGVQAAAEPIAPKESEVDISFTEGDAGVPPVDPDNPEEPLDPDGEVPGPSGPIALNYISPITFGMEKIAGVVTDYNAKTMKPFLQVTDLRGTRAGWRVTAEAKPFTNESGAVSLQGSVITLRDGEALPAYPGMTPPTPSATVTLPTSGGYIENVVVAGTGEGVGTWITRWYPSGGGPVGENDSVTLTVLPDTASLEKHTAKIVWTLIADMAS